MSNYPLPNIYLDKSIFPLHDRMMVPFDTGEKNTNNAQCIISTTQPIFPRHITIMRKLLTRGVTRKVIRVIPPCVTQE